jgi:hypothetical protein
MAEAFRSGSDCKLDLDLRTLNQRVPGSSPGAPTKPFKDLVAFTV